MKVSFNTINTNFAANLPKKKKEDKIQQLKTSNDFLNNRTKKVIGCCFAVALAIDILYFIEKRNIKYDKIKKADRLLQKRIEGLKNAPPANIRF